MIAIFFSQWDCVCWKGGGSKSFKHFRKHPADQEVQANIFNLRYIHTQLLISLRDDRPPHNAHIQNTYLINCM